MAKVEELLAKYDALKPDQQLMGAAILLAEGDVELAMLLARRVVENWEISKLRRRPPVDKGVLPGTPR